MGEQKTASEAGILLSPEGLGDKGGILSGQNESQGQPDVSSDALHSSHARVESPC